MRGKYRRARIGPQLLACPVFIVDRKVHITLKGANSVRWKGRDGEESAYGVVDVGTDHETFTTAIGTVVDGNDVAGLFIVRMGG